MMRTANKSFFLLSELESRNGYRIKRNTTGQAYNDKKAEEIFSEAENFYRDAGFLYKENEKRNK